MSLKDWLNNDDLNGECFVSGEVGEIEEVQPHRVVYFCPDTPAATQPMQVVNFTADQLQDFMLLNIRALKKALNIAVNPAIVKIAYLRFLAARNGIISPDFKPEDHHVRYSEAYRMTAEKLAAIKDPITPEEVPKEMLPVADRLKLRKNFANTVCCVAYMFRVRGHHWLPEMDAKYAALWKKCLKDEPNPLLDWQFIAHHALHAVYPDVLDDFWTDCVKAGKIAGALVKRYDSAPAGVAAVKAVYSGAQDLMMAIPGIRHQYKQHFDELDNIVADMKANRWAGSINRRYYNAGPIAFDEQKFGAIASVIYSALNAFAANSPLLQSKALERVANNAPITGGIIARSIATAVSNPKVVERMFVMSDQ